MGASPSLVRLNIELNTSFCFLVSIGFFKNKIIFIFLLLSAMSGLSFVHSFNVFVKLYQLFINGAMKLPSLVDEQFCINHILFLSVCLSQTSSCSCGSICEKCEVPAIEIVSRYSAEAPWGGIIGPGFTPMMHNLLSAVAPKLLTVHACFHDAAGYLRSRQNCGPGYVYGASFVSRLPNFCWLGHLTGILYITVNRIKHPKFFRYFDSLCSNYTKKT